MLRTVARLPIPVHPSRFSSHLLGSKVATKPLVPREQGHLSRRENFLRTPNGVKEGNVARLKNITRQALSRVAVPLNGA